MTILATRQFNNNEPISHKIYITRNTTIAGARVHLLKVGSISGAIITMDVKVNGSIIASKVRSNADLNALGTYWHGLLSFELQSPCNVKIDPLNSELLVEFIFTVSSYTNSNTNYLALVHETNPTTPLRHDVSASYYPTYGVSDATDVWNNPYGFELYTL